MEYRYLVFVVLFLQLAKGSNVTFTEVDLHKNLFENYNKNTLPKINRSEAIFVDMEFYLSSINSVDEKLQSFTAAASLSVSWKNDYMTWDMEKYPGVSQINVPNTDLWMPDLSLDGSQGNLLDIGQDKGRSVVLNDGTVTMYPNKIYTLACKISVLKFPKDEHMCKFVFLSWTYPSSIIRLKNPTGTIKMDYYIPSGEWEVINLNSSLTQSAFESMTWDYLAFQLLLRRRWMFHAMNTIAPLVCISVLNVLCFLLPVASGERITLCISIFLTLAVFLTVINDTMPESSVEVPVFSKYVGLQLFGSALTIICSVVSIYFYYKPSINRVPFLFRCLTKIFRTYPESQHPPDDAAYTRTNGQDAANGNVIKETVSVEKHVGQHDLDKQEVTWAMVSIATDRLCLSCAVAWHTILLLYLIIELNI